MINDIILLILSLRVVSYSGCLTNAKCASWMHYLGMVDALNIYDLPLSRFLTILWNTGYRQHNVCKTHRHTVQYCTTQHSESALLILKNSVCHPCAVQRLADDSSRNDYYGAVLCSTHAQQQYVAADQHHWRCDQHTSFFSCAESRNIRLMLGSCANFTSVSPFFLRYSVLLCSLPCG